MKEENQLEPKLSISEAASILGITRQALHANLRRNKLEHLKSGRVAYITHNTSIKLFSAPKPKTKIIAVHNIKGGVGKTTTSDNIGDAASLLGYRVLKIDADFQKNLTIRHNISKQQLDRTPVLIDLLEDNSLINQAILPISQGTDLLPSRFENANMDGFLTAKNLPLDKCLHSVLKPIETKYDIIIIDCPAMLGKLVTAISLFSNMILCPINPEEFSLEGLETFKAEIKNLNMAYKSDIHYKTFLNKFEASTILSELVINDTISSEIKNGHGYDIAVKKSQDVPNSQSEHITLFSKTTKSDVREDFLRLTMKILDFPTKSV